MIDPKRTRPAIRSIEPVFAAGTFLPQVHDGLTDLGLALADASDVMILLRTSPLGPVPCEVVVATLYHYDPAYVVAVVPPAWAVASPAAILERQDAVFVPLLSDAVAEFDRGDLAELAALVRTACDAVAGRGKPGRPLFAAEMARGWPDDDSLVIWRAATLLRQYRGEAHTACLVVEGLDAIASVVVHTAFEGFPADALRVSRRWSQEAWDESVDQLRASGWLTTDAALTLTDEGRRRRRAIEDRTDLLSLPLFEPLGEEGMDRVMELGSRLTETLAAAGLRPPRPRIPPSK